MLGLRHRLIVGFSGSKRAGALSLIIANATFMGRGAGKKTANSVTQIFNSETTETLKPGFFLFMIVAL